MSTAHVLGLAAAGEGSVRVLGEGGRALAAGAGGRARGARRGRGGRRGEVVALHRHRLFTRPPG